MAPRDLEWDALALNQISIHLSDGAEQPDGATAKSLPPVDAGASSEVVGDAMTRLQTIAVAITQHMSTTAGKVNLADGSYAEIENTAEDKFKSKELYPPRSERPMGGPSPLDNAPEPEKPKSVPYHR